MDSILTKHVAVIGGGCAGLAAATRLAQQGIAVILFETSSTLGGRARGVQWKGRALDNGQHILLGAYSETLRLLDLAGADQTSVLLRTPLQLTILNEFSLRASPCLPAPLHILAGLLTATGLSVSERLAAIRFMAWLQFINFKLAQDETLQNLLARKAQPARLINLLWEPICLSALNTPLKMASAQVYLNVLRDSFSKSKSDSDMLLARCDLSTLMAEPLAAYIKAKGSSVRINTPVSKVHQSGHGFLLETDDGTQTHFSHVIAAVPPYRLADLVGHLPGLAEAVSLCEQFSYQPIYTIYLQYPETARLTNSMIGFAGGYSQWVFDRGRICGQHGLLAVVISAEGAHQKLTQENLAQEVENELSKHFPHLPRPLWHKVITEKRATFACTPNLPRPAQTTALPGLYLAGDYTAGDYPATIEGGVRSGIQCANHVIST
ncbi:MAG TPA: hydroxysqualene dehydroxylase HpnE [Methylophilaceae bacterium]|nr:hydroxysqualene dehydroxylase HpnE [Methylophilaceae bacterium]